jgi:hypothetical protein
MGRTFLFAALLAALTVPVALAGSTPEDGTLSVKRGRGEVVLKLRGTVIGRVAVGRVQVKDFRPFDAKVPQLTGCKPRLLHPSLGISVCKGRNLGFRVNDGRFNVKVRGTGIWVSAVGRGPFTVDGAGDLGVSDGVMSIDDAPYSSLPDELSFYYLGVSARGR